MHAPTNSTRAFPVVLLASAAAGLLLAGGALARPSSHARASASAKFSGVVCALLKPSQVKTVAVKPVCKRVKTLNEALGTAFGAFWGGPGNITDPTYHRLSIQVLKVKSPMFLKLTEQHTQGVPIKKLGTFARAQIDDSMELLNFAVDGYFVTVHLAHQAGSRDENIGEIGAQMTKIGRSIAAKL